MATKNINKDTVKALSTKNYYSWLKEGEGATDFIISDSLSTLSVDIGAPEVGEIQDITFTDGNTNAKVKTIASGYSYAGAADQNYQAPRSLTVFGVDASAIYGGAVISSKAGNYTTINSKYTGTDVVVSGGSDIKISTVKATAVYGGGAGYGSVLNDGVNISVVGTNTISALYGGGQKGAVVNGDVNIDIDRTDARSGRISNVYGGGYDGVVNGNVTITIHGVNAEKIGTVSGSGKGKKAQVTGTRKLVISDFSGKFATTIKDFDRIVLEAGTAITLTQSQNATIQSAEYQFIIDEKSVNQKDAMLTWNKNINVDQFFITVTDEFAGNADDAFTTTIYSSTYLTQAAFDKAGMKVYGEDGKEITSGYTLEFVADLDNKGNAKKKGGSIVLSYVGSKSELNADSGDTELTDADDKTQIKGGLVRASLDTKGGNDRVTIQTETLMAGDISLGKGDNTVNVQADAEMTGMIYVEDGTDEERVKNTININGTIAGIEGGNEYTDNIVHINSAQAVGHYDNTIAYIGDQWAGALPGIGVDALEREAGFVQHDLNFTSGSNDKVYVSASSGYNGNINFAKGSDTLVLNSRGAFGGTATFEDGNDMIVANQTGITINAANLKLSGTDNVFVASNGVLATIINARAIGDFEAQYDGLYLSQNAIINVNGTLATMSYAGNIDLSGAGFGAPLTILKVAEPLDRVSEFYTAGDGVKADINAAGQNITFREGAKMDGTIYNNALGSVYRFMGTAGGNITFKNDGVVSALRVDKDAVATVGSIDGLAGGTYTAAIDTFDRDLAQINWAGKNAAVYEKNGQNLIVGFTDKDVADFATTYGIAEINQITVDGIMNGAVTFDNANVYASVRAGFNGDVSFAGANKVAVKTNPLVLDNEQMKIADGATVDFNVLDGAELIFDGIKKGEDYDHEKISVSFDKNARFAYGDTMYTKNWDRQFTAAELDAGARTKIEFVEGAVIDAGINLTGAPLPLEIKLADGVEVKGDLMAEDAGLITLGAAGTKLQVEKATVNGKIDAATNGGTDVIELNGSTINAMRAPLDDEAIRLDGNDTLNMSNGAVVNGDVTNGKLVHVMDSEVKGSINGDSVLINATIGALKGGTAFVESKSLEAKDTTTIGAVDVSAANVTLFADAANANIGKVEGLAEGEVYNNAKVGGYNNVTLQARNGATVAITDPVQTVVGDANFLSYHNGSEMNFNGDMVLVAQANGRKGNVAISAEEGGAFNGLGNIFISGGMDTNGDPIATMKANLQGLNGTLQAANNVTIQSLQTIGTELDAEGNEQKAISNLAAGDVTLVANTSNVTINAKDSVNTFGNIKQSGAITANGYAIGADDAHQGVTTIGEATTATVAVNRAASFTAGKIEQHAQTSNVTFNGTANVESIEQTAKTGAGIATVAFGDSTVLTTGAIKQDALNQANVTARVAYNLNYATAPAPAVDEKVGDIVADKASSVISSDITQESAANTFTGGVAVNANGQYENKVGDVNPAKHKDANVTFGSVEATYANIEQTGAANNVNAGINYLADGESNVTVNGASTLTMGNITQYSVGGAGNANNVAIGLGISGQNQGVLTLKGNVTGNVGAVKQTAFRADNVAWFGTARADQLEDTDPIQEGVGYRRIDDEGIQLALTLAKIDMQAYGGNNTLTLADNTTVTGSVTVGGFLTAEGEYAEWAFGDRVADNNLVNINVDTVTIGGDLGVIGLTNTLILNNASRTPDQQVNARSVNVWGDNNTLDIDYGVTINNINILGLNDVDGIGAEGYDLGANPKRNTFIVRGELNSVAISHEGSNDTFVVLGGKITGDIDTKNGNDTIVVSGDDNTAHNVVNGTDYHQAGKFATTFESKIDGNVKLGEQNDLANDVLAQGNKTVRVESYNVFEDETGATQVGVGSAKINGNVEMYTDGTNSLTATAAEFRDPMNKTTFARAEINGDVTMEAVKFTEGADGTYAVDNTVGNNVATLVGATVNGKIDMFSYRGNTVGLGGILNGRGTEEYRYPEAQGGTIDETTKVTGVLTMKGVNNVVNVSQQSGNYVNGISMEQSYVGADGNTYATEDNTKVAPENVGTNALNVGVAGNGGELRVGTSDTNADLNMGALYVQDHAAFVPALSRDARLVANPGHDAISFGAVTPDETLVTAETNTVNVVGRLTAKNVNMVADTNIVTVNGNGVIGKGGVNADGAFITEAAARTSSFTAEEDVQMRGELANTFTAQGTTASRGVEIRDEEGTTIGYQEKVNVSVRNITQDAHAGADAENRNLANDVTVNSDAVLTATGSITQTGNDTNNVNVDGFFDQVVDLTTATAYPEYSKFSSIGGSISQTTTENEDADQNTITLNRTNVGGGITQIGETVGNNATINGAVETVSYATYNRGTDADAVANYQKFYGANVGAGVTQTGAFNTAAVNDASVTGTIQQIATRGVNENDNLFGNVSNRITALATVTDAVRLVTKGEAAGHDPESVYVQGAFNTQTIGAISQSFDNTADETGAAQAQNYAWLQNANVGAVTQNGAGWFSNVFFQDSAQATFGELDKLGGYVGEKTSAYEDVNKVAYYQDIAAVTVGTVDQTGTDNWVWLTGVKQNEGAVINQTSAQFDAAAVGSNQVWFSGSAFVTAQYVDTVGIEGTAEVTKLAKLADSSDNYVKTSVGAITQTSNAQKNWTDDGKGFSDYATLAVNNTILVTDGSAVDINGKVTQKVADGVEAKLSNVQNTITLGAQAIEKSDLRIQTAATQTDYTLAAGLVAPTANPYTDPDGVPHTPDVYIETVGSKIDGAVEQIGYSNNANVTGEITGNVDQTANLLETYGHPQDNLIAQNVATVANTLTVAGIYNDEIRVTKVADGTEEIVRAEELDKGTVGNVTQTVNDALAQKTINGTTSNLANVAGNNAINLDVADFGTVNQTTTYGANSFDETASLAKANGGQAQVTGGAITQIGLSNTIGGTDFRNVDLQGNKITQTATSQANFDETTFGAASNALTTSGSFSAVQLDPAVAVPGETQKIVAQQEATYTKLGDVVQTATGVARTIETKIGAADAVSETYYNIVTDVVTNTANLTDTTAGNVTQTATGVGSNTFSFSETGRQIWKENEGAAATVDQTVFENTLGTVNQTGTQNGVWLGNGKTDFAEADKKSVVGIIQTAEAVNVWNSPAANQTAVGAWVGNNTVTFFNGGEITVGSISQTMTNKKHDSILKTDGAPDALATADVPTTGSNFVNAIGGATKPAEVTLATTKTDKDGNPITAPSKEYPDEFVNGEFLSNVGNITQTLVSESAALGAVQNNIVLNDINAGAISQTAEGYAANSLTSNAVPTILKYAYNADGFTLNPVPVAIKTDIASITQIGNSNNVNLTQANVAGDIDLRATLVGTETIAGDGTHEWEFKSDTNTITLNNVEVGGQLKALSDNTVVIEHGVITNTIVADSAVTLTGTTVKQGITTGAGDDTIVLNAGAKVEGSIDTGSYVRAGANIDNDTITINAADVDLTKATITNVETIEIKVGDTLTAASITAEDITFTTADSTIAAKSLTVTGDLVNAKTIRANTLVLGKANDSKPHDIAAFDATSTNVSFTFNDNIDNNKIYGTTGTADKLVVGADAAFYKNEVHDFDVVEFKKGATGQDSEWLGDATKNNETIAFDFKANIDFTATGTQDFTVGKFSAAWGYENSEVKFNDFVYNGTAGVWTAEADKTKAIGELDKYYSYNAGTGVVTYNA